MYPVHKIIMGLIQPNIRFTMYWLPALIAGGATLLGGILTNKSNAKQAATANALTQEQFDRSLEFNDQQAAIARSFSAQQAGITRQFNAQEAAEHRAWSAGQAQVNRDWMTRMSNSAHQREVNDLRAAGLNPILSANAGAQVGASPSAAGSAASAQAAATAQASSGGGGSYQQAVMHNPMEGAANTIRTLTGAVVDLAQVKKTEAEILEIGASIGLKEQQTKKLKTLLIRSLKTNAFDVQQLHSYYK